MTVRDLWDWAVDNRVEDHDMIFEVEVGSSEIELYIDRLERTGSRFNVKIKLS